ncbi:UDP-N-acetylglucosamine transferase subunit ALG13 [Mycena venus]|uniref:UDP-N-acetylglucosamine transferase subunit ALG13 n=1 Tax=Mycena venus TaxID=2733690 RepID=A0A8H6XBS5_9AGAR|nr:UDP-N-acetylglucosamine transferase subunit ALG13 [Mycena venus]
MLAFVTVGTFQFDALVQAVLSENVLRALGGRGYTELVVQCGKSEFELARAIAGGDIVKMERHGVRVELWRARASLDAEYARADLVIGHAGAGTILEVLRLGKPLIVVPNPTLLHNHQTELAVALAPYLKTSAISCVCLALLSTITNKFSVQRPSRHHRVLRPRGDAKVSDVRREQVPCAGGRRDGVLSARNFSPNTLVLQPIPSIVHSTTRMAPAVTATAVEADAPETYEETHVHQIYDSIASHFSSTRYKVSYLRATLLRSSIALSRGPSSPRSSRTYATGGSGSIRGQATASTSPLPADPDRPNRVWTIGLDRSRNLLEIARTAGGTGAVREVVWGDVLGHGWREQVFDYAISIATIHHLATPERRKLAVKRLLTAVSSGHGRILIYVWAVRQDELSKRSIPTDSNSNGTGQDVFVPWVLSEDKTQKQVFNRYYHMFDERELAALVTLAAEELGLVVGPPSSQESHEGVEIVQDGWERSNHYIELRRWRT